MQCTLAVRAEGYTPCSCLGNADVHIDSNSGKHVFSFYAFFNNKTCTVFESQPLNCGRTCDDTVWVIVSPSWKSSFFFHQAWLSHFLGQRTVWPAQVSYSALLQPWDCEGQNLMGRGHWFHKQRLCGHCFAGTWGKALSGTWCFLPRNARPWRQFLPENCRVHPSNYWQCSQWKRGLEEVDKIQLLTQMFQAQHKRAPGFPTCREEKAYLTLLFFTSKQHTARPLPAAHTERRVMGNGTSAHPPICNAGKTTSKAWSSWFC